MVKHVPVTTVVYSDTAPRRNQPVRFPGRFSVSQAAYTDFWWRRVQPALYGWKISPLVQHSELVIHERNEPIRNVSILGKVGY